MQVLTQQQAAEIKTVIDTPEDQNSVIFNGQVMPREEAIAKADELQVAARGYNYFDPLDVVGEFVDARLRARTMASMEWNISTQCINAARNVFYRVRDSYAENHTIDDFAEFVNSVAEISANETYMQELGYEENTGSLQSLGLMLALRKNWYDAAETASVAAGTKFKPYTLEELLEREKQRVVDTETKARLELRAAFACPEDPELAKVMLERLVAQQSNMYAEQHKTRKLIAPAVTNIFHIAEHRHGKAEVHFHQLAIDTQATLIRGTAQSIERAMNDLATWRGVTADEYMLIIREGYAAVKQLKDVLASPKFQ